jgi:hypothetical protein
LVGTATICAKNVKLRGSGSGLVLALVSDRGSDLGVRAKVGPKLMPRVRPRVRPGRKG